MAEVDIPLARGDRLDPRVLARGAKHSTHLHIACESSKGSYLPVMRMLIVICHLDVNSKRKHLRIFEVFYLNATARIWP